MQFKFGIKPGFILIFLIFTACQDPQPKEGQLLKEKPKPAYVPPPLHLESPSNVLEFTEGVEKSYQIEAEVYDDGEAEVWAENLPDGAELDIQNMEIKWRPELDFVDGRSARNLFRNHPIEVFLKSTANPNVITSQKITLTVIDSSLFYQTPVIYRQNWAKGNIIEIRRNRSEEVAIQIEDHNQGGSITEVEVIMHRGDLADIQWNNGKLKIDSKDIRAHLQFELIARSIYGTTKSEFFMLRVK